MFWLCFLWLHCVLAVATAAVEKCFLYPVDKDNRSPEFALNDSGSTLITIQHLFDRTLSTVYLNDKCLVQLGYNIGKKDVQCHTLFTNDEYARLVIRRVGHSLHVHLADSQEDEWVVSDISEHVYVTTENFINVAYDCPGRCFQFEKATVHKSFANTRKGSLNFYGKSMGNQEDKGNIQILRGSTDWRNRNSFPIKDVSASNWVTYEVAISFFEKEPTYIANGSVTYTDSMNGFSIYVVSPDLYLRFNETNSMRWAIYCRPDTTATSTTSNSRNSGSLGLLKEGDPTGHEYEYIDLNELTLSKAQKRQSYSSINSVYGYVNTSSTITSE
ncbi:uncharacterized protein [Panulirus ornatus]|uniref:uncharacterized protein isoform X3 n=1 Tax=Panulirus ornatus TaxID=150431 RepID=UPI003A89E3B4